MKQLFLHIGDPKTGTSSIQRALQRELIQSETGRVSGFINNNKSANAVTVARCFRGRNRERVRAGVKQLAPWIRGNDAEFLVLSSEFFIDANPAVLHRALNRHFPNLGKGMQVVAYARPHTGRTLSAYAERVRCGYTIKNFKDWLPEFIKQGSLEYTMRFGKWRNVFGDRFTLRPFVRDELERGDAVADFFNLVTKDPNLTVENLPHENQSLSVRGLAGLREFNRIMSDAGIAGKNRIPLARTIASLVSAHPEDKKPELDTLSVATLARHYTEDATTLDAAYFDRPIFSSALQRALASSRNEELDLTLALHFEATEQAELRRHADAVLKVLKPEWESWHTFYNASRTRQNMGMANGAESGGEIQRHLIDLGRLFSL